MITDISPVMEKIILRMTTTETSYVILEHKEVNLEF